MRLCQRVSCESLVVIYSIASSAAPRCSKRVAYELELDRPHDEHLHTPRQLATSGACPTPTH
jgi:hypothetical protein